MDGRQYFPGNYGGNYQQASDFNAASYPHVYRGMLGNYFVPGPHAGRVRSFEFVARDICLFRELDVPGVCSCVIFRYICSHHAAARRSRT